MNKSASLGFTLVELVAVVVVLGILAATALPKFVDFSKAARVASLNAMASAIEVETNHVKYLCAITPPCDVNSPAPVVTLNGKSYWLTYGYIGSGDNLNSNEIDLYVNASGFTVSLVDPGTANATQFAITNAPDPSNCYVKYLDAYYSPSKIYSLIINSSGC